MCGEQKQDDDIGNFSSSISNGNRPYLKILIIEVSSQINPYKLCQFVKIVLLALSTTCLCIFFVDVKKLFFGDEGDTLIRHKEGDRRLVVANAKKALNNNPLLR